MARVLTVSLDAYIDDWAPAVAVIAVASVVIGTLFAIAQDDIKRMLAYSSVAHAGFILLALTAGDAGVEAMWFYVATYAIQVIAAFAVVAAVNVFRAAIDAGYLWAVITALVATVAGLFFYLRVIVRMYMDAPDEGAPAIPVDMGTGWALALTSAATVALGIAPWPLLNMLRDAIPL